MPNYIAVVHTKSLPAITGCRSQTFTVKHITAGKSIDEPKYLAYEALLLHVEGQREEGELLPAPTNLENIVADPENVDAVAIHSLDSFGA
jgi:predicted RNase H-like HicB family nuclease